MNKFLHNVHAVVYSAKQNALVSKRNTGVSKPCAGCCTLFGNFLRMVEMSVEPDRMVLLEHVAKLRSDSLRAYNRSTGTDSDYLHMLDCTELLDYVLQSVVRNHKSITAGKQHVSYLRSVLDVLNCLLDIVH